VGLHFYTTDASRQGADAIQEGTLGHIAVDHFYTIDSKEQQSAQALGYTDEGVAGQSGDLTPRCSARWRWPRSLGCHSPNRGGSR
jgi:hypothetical protein